MCGALDFKETWVKKEKQQSCDSVNISKEWRDVSEKAISSGCGLWRVTGGENSPKKRWMGKVKAVWM